MHRFLTVAVPFHPAKESAVEAELHLQGAETGHGGKVRDALRDQGVHYLSLTVVPGDSGHKGGRAFLLLEASLDGGKDEALARLAGRLGPVLTGVLAAAGHDVMLGDIAAFLAKHRLETGTGLLATPGLNHTGSPGMTVERIKQERVFADQVREKLQELSADGSPLQTLERVRAHFEAQGPAEMMQPAPVPLLAPAPPPRSRAAILFSLIGRGILTFTWPYLILLALAVAVAGILAASAGGFWFVVAMMALTLIIGLGVLGAGLGFLYLKFRQKEQTDVPDDSNPDPAVLSEVMARENDGDGNHLAGISVMKPGLLRNLALRVAFWTVAQAAKTQFRPGFLRDIGTIHFARWVLLPKTNKLLFFSNYGGSWESYLEDFITKASTGLTGVWSNTEGFPRTENLFSKGATDGDRFKRWARRQQRPTRFWYRAYPNLNTRMIRLNAAIRQGLVSAKTEDEAADWLALFGSRRRKPSEIEAQEVQSVLFGGMGKLKEATCLLIALPDDPAAARGWLQAVEPDVTFGDRPPGAGACLLALTSRGFLKLGLPEAHLAEFPAAFVQGMAEPVRATRVLGDTGEDAPAHWAWGAGDKAVDAALIVYGGAPDHAAAVAAQLETLTGHGGTKVAQIDTRNITGENPVKEAFGFADGISQPIIRGTRRWIARQDAQHVVEPGEFILGYPDNRGYLPTTATLPAEADPQRHLCAYHPTALDHDWPRFGEAAAARRRDLGRNGSFLVIRQLDQDAALFKKTVAAMAKAAAAHPLGPKDLTPAQRQHWVSAKMVGRWKDGTSLVRYPFEPGTGWDGKKKPAPAPDNDFLFGSEDPSGLRCPFSAHIRRTNPRESFEPGSARQLDITNRHRILRMGRPYEPQAAGGNPGLLFMCLNGNLERQFEFIQQTWVMSRLFHGLSGEVDAILGRGRKGGQLTIPTPRGSIVLPGIQDFVTLRGGAYFFMPGKSALRYLARIG